MTEEFPFHHFLVPPAQFPQCSFCEMPKAFSQIIKGRSSQICRRCIRGWINILENWSSPTERGCLNSQFSNPERLINCHCDFCGESYKNLDRFVPSHQNPPSLICDKCLKKYVAIFEGRLRTELTSHEVTCTLGPQSLLYVIGGTDLEGRNAPADHRNEPEPKRVEPEPHSSSDTVLIGHDVDTNNPVEIGERERRSGLYVLGKPRMGKSTLFVNMIAQDMAHGRSVFFLDPHGQAITDLFERYPHTKFALEKNCIHLLDPTDNDYSFGLKGRDVTINHAALDRSEVLIQQALNEHGLAKETLDELRVLLMNIHGCRRSIKTLESDIIALMEGGAVCRPGDETFARCIQYLVGSPWVDYIYPDPAFDLYIWLTYGDPYKERTIRHLDWNIDFLRKYFYPQAEAAYVEWMREIGQKHLKTRVITTDDNPYLKEPIVVPPISPEKLEAELNEDRQAFQRGYHIGGYTSGGQYIDNQWIPPGQYIKTTSELVLPSVCDVPLGVFNESETTRIREVCARELLEHNSPELFQRMDEAVEFCQLLAQPENHILVPSGQYVEKPVQIASTQEMFNQAVQTLTDLPKYTAYAKIIDEKDGKQTTWSGKIETRNFPSPHQFVGLEEQALKATRSACNLRSDVQQAINQRRVAWRKPEPPKPPEGGPSRQQSKVLDTPPPTWDH